MTRIDFYILKGTSNTELLRLACRLVDKAWQRKMQSFINVADNATAGALDDMLWTFRDTSFLSHTHAGSSEEGKPVAAVIGCDQEPRNDYDLLINLSPDVPAFFSRFERVAELIDNEPTRRDDGRQRFRFYRDRGYPLDTHNLS